MGVVVAEGGVVNWYSWGLLQRWVAIVEYWFVWGFIYG